MRTYIHYGSNKFHPYAFVKITNCPQFTKPFGGLWASPVDAKYGWKDWCEDSRFNVNRLKKSFTFTLAPEAKVLYIRSTDDFENLPKQGVNVPSMWTALDFELLRQQGYDAVELVDIEAPGLYWALYGWDCDSILIMNPGIIRVDET